MWNESVFERTGFGVVVFRRQALEGVQKDVRRTVSVMQYNILASCDVCFATRKEKKVVKTSFLKE